jgi:plastocyanin
VPTRVNSPVSRSRPLRLVAIVVFTIAPLIASCSRPRTMVVTCRNMAFLVPGDPTANPIVRVTTGETIRLELRNEDGPGVLHDLAIDPLGVATELVQPGQTSVVTFTAPDRPGRYDYYCRPHALVMRGTLDVVAR